MKRDKKEGKPSHKDLRKAEPEDPLRHTKKPKKEERKDGVEGSRYNHAGRWRTHQRYRQHGQCNFPGTYSGRFDAYYCKLCDLWLETKCDKTKNCSICLGRKKPSSYGVV